MLWRRSNLWLGDTIIVFIWVYDQIVGRSERGHIIITGPQCNLQVLTLYLLVTHIIVVRILTQYQCTRKCFHSLTFLARGPTFDVRI